MSALAKFIRGLAVVLVAGVALLCGYALYSALTGAAWVSSQGEDGDIPVHSSAKP